MDIYDIINDMITDLEDAASFICHPAQVAMAFDACLALNGLNFMIEVGPTTTPSGIPWYGFVLTLEHEQLRGLFGPRIVHVLRAHITRN